MASASSRLPVLLLLLLLLLPFLCARRFVVGGVCILEDMDFIIAYAARKW